MSKIVAIVEARMSSTRLPGKTLKKILGKPMLVHLLERLKRAKTVNEVIVATSTEPDDAAIEKAAASIGVRTFRGSLNDVLGRVVAAARFAEADIIVEITGDCPLVDPDIVDTIVNKYLEGGLDYVSNVLEGSYPAGMDVQVFSAKVLEEVSRLSNDPEEREHGSWLIYRNPEKTKYKLLNVKCSKEQFNPNLRLFVDYPKDFEFVTKIYENLYPAKPSFGIADMLKLIKEKPELLNITEGLAIKVFEGQKIADSAD